VHSRRYLTDAYNSSPVEIDVALNLIGKLYQIEKQIRQQGLSGDKKRTVRQEQSLTLVNEVFQWVDTQCLRGDLTPKHPLTQCAAASESGRGIDAEGLEGEVWG
jgi:transposase